MNALYMILGTLVALGLLVTFHEFGHFWVARRCGIRVLRFSVGFGKPLLRWHDKHQTEYCIAAIPLGGYVKMLDEREGEVPVDQLHAAFNRKPVGHRFATVAAGPIANFILAFMFFWLLALVGSTQVRPLLGQLDADGLAARAGLHSGQELVAIDGRPVQGWGDVNLALVRRLGDTGVLDLQVRERDNSAPVSYRIALHDWLKDVDQPNPIAGLGINPWVPRFKPVLGELDGKGPAVAAGLRSGDRLVAFDQQPVKDWQGVVDWVRVHPNTRVEVSFERGGQLHRQQVLLSSHELDGHSVGYLGAGVQGAAMPADMLREVRYGPLAAIGVGLQRTWTMSVLTVDSLWKMVLGEVSVKNLSGPITIAKVAGASARSGFSDFINFLAYLSISLAVLNLMPVPILDGGHMLFYLIEMARGRPVSERVQVWGTQIGISLVLGLVLLALFNDLSRL